MSNFRELVKDFGTAAGVAGLELNADGLCRIVIDGSTTIDFELDQNGDVLLLAGQVLPDVAEAEADVFATALIMNMNIGTNKGSFLAFDEGGDELILLRRLEDDGLHFGDFQTILNEFAAYLGHCRDTLTSGLRDDDEDDDQEDGPEPTASSNSATDMVFRL